MLHDLSVKQPEWAFARNKKVLSSYLLVLAKGRSILASVTNVVGSAKFLRKVVLVPSLNISQGMTHEAFWDFDKMLNVFYKVSFVDCGV